MGSDVLTLPERPVADLGAVVRVGLGYRGKWHRQGIELHLTHVHRSRQEVTGQLVVAVGGRSLHRGRFNASSLTTRRTLATYLKDTSDGYTGWSRIVEDFCVRVLEYEDEGEPVVRLVDMPLPEAPNWRLEPMIPRNVATILFGPGGSMKSTLAAAIAVSVASGRPLFGWQPAQCPVLVVDWESGADEWHRRMAAIAAGMGLALPADIHHREGTGPLTDMAEWLSGEVARLGVGLLIVDSVGMASGAGHEGGDANEATIRLFGALRSIRTTSLLIDHVTGDVVATGKDAEKPYGSIFKVNLARSVWSVRKEARPGEDGTQLLLKHIKVNEGRLLRDMGLRVRHGDETIDLSPCEIDAPDLEGHTGTVAEQMVRVLSREGAMTVADLAERIDKPANTVRALIHRHKQQFIRLGSGKVGALSAMTGVYA